MKRSLIIAVIAAPCLLALSYPWRNTTHGAGVVLGTIGWLGFLLSVLIIIVISAVMGISRLRHRRTQTS